MLDQRSGPDARAHSHLDLDGAPVAASPLPAELAVIVPTYNESANLAELVARVEAALAGVAWEMIVVDDDSPDMTARHALALHRRDPRVRVLRRIGRRGLSSACIEGMLACGAPYIAVIDADLQHDPALLRPMLERLRQGDEDLVVGSRYVAGGATGDWSGGRLNLSRLTTRLARGMLNVELADPMSGYFALRREVVDDTARELSGLGFKILFDLLLSAKAPLRVAELPYEFGVRTRGRSKLSASVLWQCGLLFADKLIGRYLPARMITFGLVGLIGVGVHFLVLSGLYRRLGIGFALAQTTATVAAIVVNFTVNNLVTYGGALTGPKWWRGLASFGVVCGLGGLANVAVASWLFSHHAAWPVAAIAGIAAGAVWNYAASAKYTWRSA